MIESNVFSVPVSREYAPAPYNPYDTLMPTNGSLSLPYELSSPETPPAQVCPHSPTMMELLGDLAYPLTRLARGGG
jgi:hypothetical protein